MAFWEAFPKLCYDYVVCKRESWSNYKKKKSYMEHLAFQNNHQQWLVFIIIILLKTGNYMYMYVPPLSPRCCVFMWNLADTVNVRVHVMATVIWNPPSPPLACQGKSEDNQLIFTSLCFPGEAGWTLAFTSSPNRLMDERVIHIWFNCQWSHFTPLSNLKIWHKLFA